jgi:hypothetical protein
MYAVLLALYPRYIGNQHRAILAGVQMPPPALSSVVPGSRFAAQGTSQSVTRSKLKMNDHFTLLKP